MTRTIENKQTLLVYHFIIPFQVNREHSFRLGQPAPTRKSGLKLSAEPPAMFRIDNFPKWAVLDQDH